MSSYMQMNLVLIALTAIILSGCLESDQPLFQESEAAKSVLADNYIVTDGKSPLGELTLTENDGQYTILAASDEDAFAELEVGRTFRLFQTQIINHEIERSWGPLRYFWVEAKKTDQPGFEYELLGVTTRTDLRREIVFRWGLWTYNGNELFVQKLEELVKDSNAQIGCKPKEKYSICIESDDFLNQLSELVVEAKFMPVRAYVPR